MLKQIKENYQHQLLQFILTDETGCILESDQTILKVQKGSNLGDFHPFFISVPKIMCQVGKKNGFSLRTIRK